MTDYPTAKLSVARRVLIVLATALVALTVGMGAAASAGTTSKHDQAVARFAAQATAAGLSNTQAGQLQAKVDRFIAEHGGTQVAPDRIALKDGYAQFAVPGESRVRGPNLGPSVRPQQSCPYYNFCAYRGQYYSGDVRGYYYCNDQSMPWASTGSYINNQTPGTVARFKNSSRVIIGSSCGAYCAVPTGVNWLPIFWIDPC